MTTHDMRHMDYIDAVTARDMEVLVEKESTYQGSWKREGGRSAYFMMKRNMDRLAVMMAKPEPPHGFSLEDLDDALYNKPHFDVDISIVQYLRDSYAAENIFAKIRENASGDDGTVLAVMRDLRRYLILIEAEMMSRGVLTADGTPPPLPVPPSATAAQLAQAAQGTVRKSYEEDTMRTVPRATEQKAWIPDTPSCGDGSFDARMQRLNIEAGNEPLAPWFVPRGWFLRKDVEPDLVQKFWHPVGPAHLESTLFALEPHVENARIPGLLRGIYDQRGDHYLIRMSRCPEAARENFPTLCGELNMKEHEELPAWQRPLYTHHESEGKFRLSDAHVAWGGGL